MHKEVDKLEDHGFSKVQDLAKKDDKMWICSS